jgi:hypothetical protein
LARRSGIVNVDAMLRRITARQFRELEVFEELEPPESVRDDYRTASIVTMIANVNRGPKQKAYTLQDFVLNFREVEPKKPQSPQEQLAILKILAMQQALIERNK